MPVESNHISEEALELYSLGLLGEAEVTPLEEHLLVCAACQERLIATDEYVRAMRMAAARYRSKHPFPASPSPLGWFLSYKQSRFALAAGAICLVLILFWVTSASRRAHGRGDLPPLAVALQAVRNAEAQTAPAGRALLIRADIRGLGEGDSWRLEVADQSGKRVALFPVQKGEGQLEAQVPTGLGPGLYWVRVFASDPATDPAREYALRVE